jgi:CHAT domain-containing protein
MAFIYLSRYIKIISSGLLVLFISCNISKTGVDKNVSMQWYYNYGTRLNKQNNFKEAITAFNKSLYYANNFHNDKVKAECYDGIAYAFFRLNKYQDANRFYANALLVNPPLSKLTNAHLLCALGNGYHFAGIIDSAEYYYQQADKLALTPDDACNVWNSWGLLKQQLGQYDSSFILFSKAKSQIPYVDSGILKQELLMNLGVLNFIMNDTAATFRYYAAALEEADKTHDTIGKAIILLNRVRLYLELQQSDNASIDFRNAKNLMNSTSSSNLDDAYNWLKLCEAEKYYRSQDTIFAVFALQSALRRIEADENPFFRLCVLSALGSVKNSAKEYDTACNIYQKAISFIDSSRFNQFEFKISAYNGIAKSYEGLNIVSKAEDYYQKASNALKDQVQSQMSFFSESDRTQYLESVQSFFESPGSFAMRVKDKNPEMCSMIYDNCLFLKGSQVSGTRKMLETISKDSNPKTLQIFSQWKKLKSTIAFQSTLPYDKRTTDLYEIQEKANELERELMQASNAFAAEKEKLDVNWEMVRAKLKTTEAAIEFISINKSRTDGTKQTDYCALVLRQGYEYPKLVSVAEMDQLLEHLNRRPNEHDTAQINRIYEGHEMYDLIWKPLENLLEGVETVYYSPVGLLHTVSFGAIRMQDHRYLSDKYDLNLITSTKQIVFPDRDFRLSDIESAALFGGIDYGTGQFAQGNGSKNKEPNGTGVSYLEETLSEILEVERTLRKNGIQPSTYKEQNATETSFVKEVNGKGIGIIHISTHGIYFRDLKVHGANLIYGEQVLRHADNPLLRSGLLMAGVNDKWNGKPPIEETEDGVLTAYEVANTDLSETKLAVLSACETGLGDIKGTEGVYGLQRAFKIAGVPYVIMSLWKVPDKQTTELMKTFYENWSAGLGIREAFREAQSLMSKKYNPYYWAAFVLSN